MNREREGRKDHSGAGLRGGGSKKRGLKTVRKAAEANREPLHVRVESQRLMGKKD